jgi:hypothetical protein
MCNSELHCAIFVFIVLQWATYNELHCVTLCHSLLQWSTLCYIVLHCTALFYIVLQYYIWVKLLQCDTLPCFQLLLRALNCASVPWTAPPCLEQCLRALNCASVPWTAPQGSRTPIYILSSHSFVPACRFVVWCTGAPMQYNAIQCNPLN